MNDAQIKELKKFIAAWKKGNTLLQEHGFTIADNNDYHIAFGSTIAINDKYAAFATTLFSSNNSEGAEIMLVIIDRQHLPKAVKAIERYKERFEEEAYMPGLAMNEAILWSDDFKGVVAHMQSSYSLSEMAYFLECFSRECLRRLD